MSKLFDFSSLAMIPSAYKDGKLYSVRPIPEYGAELVTNGTFDTDSNWTKGTGWTISGGKANVASGSDGAALSQDISKVGVVNKVVFTISNYTGSGFIRLRTGDASQVQDFSANGTYSFVVTPTTTTFSFARYMNGSLSIDNVSVKEVLTASGDFDFSRGSNLAATRVASSGYIEKGRENLYTQSNNFSHSDWTPKAGTFTQGETDPNGGTDAWAWEATNTDPYLYQSKNFTGVHTLSIYVKGVGSTIGADFQIRTGTNLKDVTLTAAWQRVEHFGVLSGSVNIGFEYGNPATAGDIVHIYAAQLELGTIATDYIESGASTAKAGILEDMPRLDYSGGASCPALLLEPQRTNLITNSEYSGGFIANEVTINDNELQSPEGVNNAFELIPTTANTDHRLQQSFTQSAGTSYTYSIYAKPNGYNFLYMNIGASRCYAVFDLSDGSIEYTGSNGTDWENETASIEDAGNGWYRCILSGETITTAGGYARFGLGDTAINNYYNPFAGDGTSGGYFYGIQVEEGSYPTSYIPTYGSAVTRNADRPQILNTTTDILSQTAFTLFFEADLTSDTTNNYRDIVAFTGSAKALRFETRTDDSVRVQTNMVTSGDNWNSATIGDVDNKKFALTFTTSQVRLYADGSLVSTYNGVYESDLYDILFVNSLSTGVETKTNFKQYILFPTALTDSECIALTTL